ncbi:protein of unknown function [Candidatus Nitrosocosmicus franklandus]|uniref:Uncharacterized protein n=1 Tax=Candidatus Nitrosocosmicus franklandianus TaxID=1798806 RepID=A0A484I513_9ARCH|nr:protein of unknown function [Candidatus Nitrosocosmicus franklandus]
MHYLKLGEVTETNCKETPVTNLSYLTGTHTFDTNPKFVCNIYLDRLFSLCVSQRD